MRQEIYKWLDIMSAIEKFVINDIILEIPETLLVPEIREAMEQGYYEIEELSSLRHLIRAGDRVLELGGGIGFISTFAIKYLHASHVCSVEANEILIPVIQQNHKLNNVYGEVLHGLASIDDGYSDFHRTDAFWASSSHNISNSVKSRVLSINTSKLIDRVRPDVLIVDIEGGEEFIFQGLVIPDCVRSIMCEIHPAIIGGHGIISCFESLHQIGFSYDVKGSSGAIVAFDRK